MKLVLLGPPGAGKGAQAEKICERYNLTHISTGDMLRAEVSANTGIGREIGDIINSGNLVSDELMIKLVARRLACDDAKAGYVLDGFPRTISQARAADAMTALSLVINFVVDESILIERICSRRVCASCNCSFNGRQSSSLCTHCGGKLIIRDDDTQEVFRARLKVHERLTAPIVAHYAALGLLVNIDGSKDIDTVFSDIINAFSERGLV